MGRSMRMVEAPADGVSHMADVGQFQVSVVRTSKPWLLDIATIVLSVGSTLGELGHAVSDQYPELNWDSIDYERIWPQRPVMLDLDASGRHGGHLRRAILATP